MILVALLDVGSVVAAAGAISIVRPPCVVGIGASRGGTTLRGAGLAGTKQREERAAS